MVFVAHGTSKQKLEDILERNYLHRGMFVWDASTLEEDYPRDQAEELSRRKATEYAWRWATFKYGLQNAAVLTFEVDSGLLVKGSLSANEKMLTKDLALYRDVVGFDFQRDMPADIYVKISRDIQGTLAPIVSRRPVRSYWRQR